MKPENQVVLASTLHEPQNRLSILIERSHRMLKKIFKTIIVVATKKTHPDVVRLLENLNFDVKIGNGSIVSNYKKALRETRTENPENIFCCDFDRALHWIENYPEELAQTMEQNLIHDFILYGRTSRAFQTHPATQTDTEGIANQICSNILDLTETRDIISACWRFSPKLAEKIIQLPSKNRYGFYVQWPIHAWKIAERPTYIKVEGLEWETPDRYQSEIQKIGFEKWIKSFQTPREWRKRVQILRDVVESSLRIQTPI